MNDINVRLDKLRERVQDTAFLEGRGLSNEVNIHLFCYDPKDEMVIRSFIEKFTTDQSLSCHIIEYNLYKVFLSICDSKHITDKIAVQEDKKGQQFILEQLIRVANNVAFAEKMQYEPHNRGDVLLITGVGEAFPFIRVHSLLEAMQPLFPNMPILVMYPGTFDGHSLSLFNELAPNSYYRAFNVI